MPRRLVGAGGGGWGRWARFVLRRPLATAVAGLAVIAVLAGDRHADPHGRGAARELPGRGDGDRGPRRARRGRDHPRRDEADRRARRARRRRRGGRVEAARGARHRGRERDLAGRPGRDGRGAAGDRRRRARDRGDPRPLRGGAARHRRDRDRPGRRRPRLPRRPLGADPVDPRARPRPDDAAADAGVPLDRAPAQGGRAEPALARRGVRRRRARLPVRLRLLAVGRARRGLRDRLGADHDLRVPVRPLDGLRGLHARRDARGLRRDGLDRPRDRARPRPDGQARDERGADPDVRVPRALDQPGLRDQAARDRHRGRHRDRRDDHPRAARPRPDAPDGGRELVAAAPARVALAQAGRRDAAAPSGGTTEAPPERGLWWCGVQRPTSR